MVEYLVYINNIYDWAEEPEDYDLAEASDHRYVEATSHEDAMHKVMTSETNLPYEVIRHKRSRDAVDFDIQVEGYIRSWEISVFDPR